MKPPATETVPIRKKRVPTPAADFRRYRRHFCKERPGVSLIVTGSEVESFQAMVRDVSREGVGLILLKKVNPGSVLKIQFQWIWGGPCWTFAAEVKHAARQGDGSWLLGLHTSRAFTDDELSALRLHFPAYETRLA